MYTPIINDPAIAKDSESWLNKGVPPDPEAYNYFFLTYGESLAAWSGVESGLLSVFGLFINSKERESVRSSFYSLSGFRARLDLANSAIDASSYIEYEKNDWQELYKKCLNKGKSRNKIAHGTIYYLHHEQNVHRRFFLAKPTNRQSRMYLADLRMVRDGFRELSRDIHDFYGVTLENNSTTHIRKRIQVEYGAE